MKKRPYIVLGLVITGCILSGCSVTKVKQIDANSNVKIAEEAVPDTEEDNTICPGVLGKKIAICISDGEDPYLTLYQKELVSYLKSGGANVLVFDAKKDELLQQNQIKELIDKGVQALIVAPVSSKTSSIETITKAGKDKQVPIVFVEKEPLKNEETKWKDENLLVSYVGSDNRQAGTFQGELIVTQTNRGDFDGDGKVKYVLLTERKDTREAFERSKFCIQALADIGLGTEELDVVAVGNDRKAAYDTIKKDMKEKEIPEVIFCNNDTAAIGALDALTDLESKVGKHVYLVGIDGIPEALKNVKAGNFTGTVYRDYKKLSHLAGEAVGTYLNGERPDTVIRADYQKATIENVDKLLQK